MTSNQRFSGMQRGKKKQKHEEEKNQPIKTNQELSEMLELGKGIKIVIITVFWMLGVKWRHERLKKKKKKTQISLTG